jgi:hypothetical protein
MTSSKIKRPDSIKLKSKGGRKDAVLKGNGKAKSLPAGKVGKTLTATAIKKAKGKLVKVEKKIVAKAKPVAKKLAIKKPAVKKAIAKKIVAKKVAPKKAVKPASSSGGKVADKKVTSRASVTKQAAKKVAPKKIAKPAKKVAAPVKRKVKAVVLKKVIKLTNGEMKKTELKAKTSSSKAKKEIAIESSIVSPINTVGEDLHFIPEHDLITITVTQTEARQIESIFHHKEDVAFHQENQKIRNALPSRKTMNVFNRNQGRK